SVSTTTPTARRSPTRPCGPSSAASSRTSMPPDARAAYQQLAHASATRTPGGILAGLLVGIDHVGLCVSDMAAAGGGWAALLGVPLTDREDVAPQKTTAAFLRMPE